MIYPILEKFYINHIFKINFFILLLICYLIIINFNDLTKLFSKIKRRYFLILLIIFLVNLIFLLLIKPFHYMWIDEHWYMEAGKNMLIQGKPISMCSYIAENSVSCINYSKGIAWPFLISILFALFGFNNWIILYSSLFLCSLSVILVFFVSYLLFKNEKVALVSSFLTALSPVYMLQSLNAETNGVSMFFVLLSFLFLFFYFKSRTTKSLLLFVLSLFFVIEFRHEYGLLLVVVFFFFVLNWVTVKKQIRNPRFFIVWMVFLVLLFVLLPSLIMQFNLERCYEHPGPCFSVSFIIKNLGFGLKSVTNNSLIFALFALLGCAMMFKYDRKNFCFLSSLFLLFFLFYLFYTAIDDIRFFVVPLFSLIFFVGYGVWQTTTLFKDKKIKNIIFIVLVFVLIASLSFKVLELRGMVLNNFVFQKLETAIPELAEKEISLDCYVVTEWPMILMATTNMKGVSTHYALEDKEFIDRLTRDKKCLIFFKDIYCEKETDQSYERCEKFINTYHLQPYINFTYKDLTFTFYNVTQIID